VYPTSIDRPVFEIKCEDPRMIDVLLEDSRRRGSACLN
jgi:hypothetical protein